MDEKNILFKILPACLKNFSICQKASSFSLTLSKQYLIFANCLSWFIYIFKTLLYRTLMDDYDKPIVDNYRPPQPLNNRTVSFFKAD